MLKLIQNKKHYNKFMVRVKKTKQKKKKSKSNIKFKMSINNSKKNFFLSIDTMYTNSNINIFILLRLLN